MKEDDIFLPLYYNDGSPVEPRKFRDLQAKLLAQFHGLTFFAQPNQGIWQMGDVTYHDEIVIYRGDYGPTASRAAILSQLKEDLKRSFRQEEVLIVERDVATL